MNYRDLHRELKAGNITIDYKGHLCNDATDSILRQIEHLFESENASDISKELQEYYTKMVERELQIGTMMREADSTYCFTCGERHCFILTDEKTLTIFPVAKYMEMTTPTDRTVKPEDIGSSGGSFNMDEYLKKR